MQAALLSIEILDAMEKMLDEMDLDRVAAAQANHDAVAAQRLIFESMIGVGRA